MRKKEYTEKDLKLSRKITVSVTGLYIIISIFFSIMNGRRVDNVSEELLMAGVLWWHVLPMIMIICWYMCMERYLVIEFKKLGEQDTMSKRIWYYVSVVLLSLTGITIYQAFKDGIGYVVDNKNLLDNLQGCVLLRFGVCLIGGICLFYGFKIQRRIIQAESNRKKTTIIGGWVGLLIVVLLIQVGVGVYTYHKREDVWYKKMVEYYEEHQGEQNVEPFSRN